MNTSAASASFPLASSPSPGLMACLTASYAVVRFSINVREVCAHPSQFGWRSSMAEQRFCKPQVGGSIPLASSTPTFGWAGGYLSVYRIAPPDKHLQEVFLSNLKPRGFEGDVSPSWGAWEEVRDARNLVKCTHERTPMKIRIKVNQPACTHQALTLKGIDLKRSRERYTCNACVKPVIRTVNTSVS